MSQPYPFRFYGGFPVDWFEGANLGHTYEVRFRTAPDEPTAQRLAETFERWLWWGPGETAATKSAAPKPWEWSGPVALLMVGERWRDARPLFGHMARVFRALHEIAPIEDVVFWGARDPGMDPWTAWSISQRELPLPGPEYESGAGPAFYRRAVDAELPAPVVWEAFEAARRAARQALLGERVGELSAEGEQAASEGRIAYVRALRADADFAVPIDAELRRQLGQFVAPSGYGRLRHLAIEPSGDRLAIAADHGVAAVQLPEGSVERVATEPAAQVAFTAAGDIVALDEYLRLYRREADGYREVDRLRALPGGQKANRSLALTEDGQIAVAEKHDYKKATLFIASVSEEGLQQLAKLDTKILLRGQKDGAIYGAYEGQLFELVNLHRVQAAAPPKKTSKKTAKGKTPKPALSLAVVPPAELPSDPRPEVTAEIRARFAQHAALLVTASGRAVALEHAPGMDATFYRTVAWTDEHGQVQRLSKATQGQVGALISICADDSGRAAYVVGHNRVFRLALTSGELRCIWKSESELENGPVRSVDVLPSGLAIQCSSVLVTLACEDGAWSESARAKVSKGCAVVATPDGRSLLVLHEYGSKKVSIFGYDGSQLKLFGTEKVQARTVQCIGNRAFIWDEVGNALEVQNLEAVWASKFG